MIFIAVIIKNITIFIAVTKNTVLNAFEESLRGGHCNYELLTFGCLQYFLDCEICIRLRLFVYNCTF